MGYMEEKNKGGSNAEGPVTPTMNFSEVLQKYPETIEIFVAYGLHCVACSLAEFDTVQEAALIHGINPEMLLRDLNRHIREKRKNVGEGAEQEK
jgi:hybrid cluster-associated redox disulfide protein